jgi:hypothetical protein
MPQRHKCARGALLSLAALLLLLAVPAAAVPAPSHANVVPTSSTVVTSPTVVAKLSRTGSSSRTLTLVAGLALLLAGVAVGLGEPAPGRSRS